MKKKWKPIIEMSVAERRDKVLRVVGTMEAATRLNETLGIYPAKVGQPVVNMVFILSIHLKR